jgi:HlyD family secretion protein
MSRYAIFLLERGQDMETAKRVSTENEHVFTPRKKKWILLGIFVLLFISVILSVALVEVKKSKSKTLEIINPTERNFIKTTTVPGRVVQSHTETIYVNATKGSIQEIFVKEGETVSKGQKLFSYEDSTAAAELGQAEVNKKISETSVTQKKEQITTLEQSIREAETTTEPDTTNVTSEVDLANKTSMIQSLQAELSSAKAELIAAELKVETYSLQVEKLKAQQDALTVNSNTAGVILNLNQNVGQGFKSPDNEQIAIMQVVSKDPFQIEGTLTEAEKAKIKTGQSITVTSNVVANKKWKGKILEVSDYPIYKTSENKDKDKQQEPIPMYSFKANLDSQKGLYPGYSTSINVVVQSKQLLAVPQTSIMGSGKSKYVYVLKKGTIHKQKVETGQKSGKWVAILQGLKKEDKIGKNPSWTVRPGTKITLDKKN